ncbi:hypothetical protein LMG667_02520 [Xanthomonas euvesicatoria]|uniref:hypothetical protein n=1 Tax=Xanthomonas euvesicatoria TaxID=456327 RepID=UPI00080D9D34|nr:hypothetical protein [Xanthomonas euvesicatoria]OCG90315.1 hypothetical protein LMG667_02520 [Xanthomonas euvesicatoria]
MSHYRWLEERIPALTQCGQAAPFLHLTSRIEGGEGADADISLEDDGAVSIAITEVDSGGRRVAVCAALFAPGSGILSSWGTTISLASPAVDPVAHLSLLDQYLVPMKEIGP